MSRSAILFGSIFITSGLQVSRIQVLSEHAKSYYEPERMNRSPLRKRLLDSLLCVILYFGLWKSMVSVSSKPALRLSVQTSLLEMRELFEGYYAFLYDFYELLQNLQHVFKNLNN